MLFSRFEGGAVVSKVGVSSEPRADNGRFQGEKGVPGRRLSPETRFHDKPLDLSPGGSVSVSGLTPPGGLYHPSGL